MIQLSQSKLSDLIREQRAENNMTQEQLSKLTGINRAMIGKIERQAYIPSISQLECLVKVLEIDITTLFVDNNKPSVFTAFRGENLTAQEQDGVNHLFEMMLAAKQQIMLRKALHHD